jgi:hypothetical protein
MLYRTLQRHLRRLKSTIALNQKKTILLEEFERLSKPTTCSFIELRAADEIKSFMTTMNKEVFCGPLGSDEYWQGLLTYPVDIVIKAIIKDIVVGFVLIRTNYGCEMTGCMIDTKWNSFYIELICSNVKRGGISLIDRVKHLARLENVSNIHLSSVVDLIPYYADKHHFLISRDCYPQMETEIAHLLSIVKGIKQIQDRREELKRPNKQVRYRIKAERIQMNKQMGILSRQKKSLIDKFRQVSTFQLKYPDRVATAKDVVDEGVYMSFCMPQ